MWFTIIGLAISAASFVYQVTQNNSSTTPSTPVVTSSHIAQENLNNMNAFADDAAVTASLTEQENSAVENNSTVINLGVFLGVGLVIYGIFFHKK